MTELTSEEIEAANQRLLEKRAKIAAMEPEFKPVSINFPLNQIKQRMERHRRKFLPLIQRAPQTVECEIHDGQIQALNVEDTLCASYNPDELRLVYEKCELCDEERRIKESCVHWLAMGVPRKTALATLDNYVTDSDPLKIDALKRVRKQVARQSGFLVLFGKYGNGKTHLATAAFKKLGGGLFVTFGELVDQLRTTYTDGGKEKLIKKYQQCKNFVLDEVELLGKSRDGDVQSSDIQPFLYRILAYRFDRDMFSCLTSNEDLTTILAILGPRLEDRMAQNYTSVSFTWDSYRRANRVR